MKKLMLVFILGLAAAGAVLLFNFLTQKGQGGLVSSTPSSPAPTPQIIEQGESKSRFVTTDNYSSDLPTELPLLEVEKSDSLSESEIAGIARSFGFLARPTVANDIIEGEVLVYADSEKGLIIFPKSGRLSFSLNKIPGRPVNPQDLTLLESQLVSTVNSLTEIDVQLEKSSSQLLAFDGSERIIPVDKAIEASVLQVNLSPTSSKYSIISNAHERPPFYGWISMSGEVTRIETVLAGDFKASKQMFKVKTRAEILEELSSSTLVSIDDGNIHIPDTRATDLGVISPTNITVGYLTQNLSEKQLVPIFVIQGRALFRNNLVNTVSYLPALK